MLEKDLNIFPFYLTCIELTFRQLLQRHNINVEKEDDC